MDIGIWKALGAAGHLDEELEPDFTYLTFMSGPIDLDVLLPCQISIKTTSRKIKM